MHSLYIRRILRVFLKLYDDLRNELLFQKSL